MIYVMGLMRITIYSSQKSQIALLNVNVEDIIVSSEYSDFIDVFSPNFAAESSEYNNTTIIRA